MTFSKFSNDAYDKVTCLLKSCDGIFFKGSCKAANYNWSKKPPKVIKKFTHKMRVELRNDSEFYS